MNIHNTLAAAIATLALAAPAAAVAQPADMHASTAQAAAKALQRQDLRSPDAIDAAQHPRKAQAVVNAPGATVADSQAKSTPVAPGQPTWAVNPQPIKPAPAPAVATSDDGTDWTTIGIGIGLTLILLGGIAVLTNRLRPASRARVSA